MFFPVEAHPKLLGFGVLSDLQREETVCVSYALVQILLLVQLTHLDSLIPFKCPTVKFTSYFLPILASFQSFQLFQGSLVDFYFIIMTTVIFLVFLVI